MALETDEEWMEVDGFPGYQVSSLGNVRSSDRFVRHPRFRLGQFVKGNLLRTQKDRDGYRVVMLYRNGRSKLCKVHRLVATAFIPNKNNNPVINHKNSIRDDNRIKNLEWTDNSGNQKHAFREGNQYRFGEHHSQNKLRESDVFNIVSEVINGIPQRKLADRYKVSVSTVNNIMRGKSWQMTMIKIIPELIKKAITEIELDNRNFPCRENSLAITKLEEALMWLEQRKKNREKRGVEGTSQA